MVSKIASNDPQRPIERTRRCRKGVCRSMDPDTPGNNALSLIAFLNGERGFLVKGYDDSALAFFNLDGDSISNYPGRFSVLRKLGEYLPGDMDAFWALVMQV